MSIVNPVTGSDGTVVVPPDVPSTLTITHYKQLAEQFRKVFSDAVAIVPTADPGEFANAEASRRRLNVPLEFLRTAIASVERNPELQNVQKLNVLLGQDTLQYLEAFRPMLDELLAFVNRLTLTLQSRQATLSIEALHIYDVAKSVNRDERSPELSAAIANMKRDLGRRGRPPIPVAVRKAARLAGAAAEASVIAAATSPNPPAEGKPSS
jgi:hypothetical protein